MWWYCCIIYILFYNPKNVTYEITFKSNENINLSLDYIVNVKNIIEKERINGEYINEKEK